MVTASGGALHFGDRVTPYDIATPLFSDYALKLRTVWLPKGESAKYTPDGAFDFPVGAVITKTFYYRQDGETWNGVILEDKEPPLQDGVLPMKGLRMIETRVLVHRPDGWTALPYVWNDDQTDAVLKRTGAVERLTIIRRNGDAEEFAYLVPNANQCAECHATNATTRAIKPIGPKARNLNKPSTYAPGENQLDRWVEAGLLTGDYPGPDAAPRNADWTDQTAALDARARAYLDANCSHCHNPDGAADTSGLDLEPKVHGPAMGFCKTPVAAGTGTGGLPFDIVPGAPEKSILLFRMETTDPGAMMPELGRALTHKEGVALIAKWIAQMQGSCY